MNDHTEVPDHTKVPASYGSEAMVIVYCWLCDAIAHRHLAATHYESRRPLFFCGEGHKREYLWLLNL
jgi:hypothetical protein